MLFLSALPLTAVVSALHGWGRFPKGLSFPLLAVMLWAMLYVDGVPHWYAGIIPAALWRFTSRTGKIARRELDVLNPNIRAYLDVISLYRHTLIATCLCYVLLSVLYLQPFYLFGIFIAVGMAYIHQRFMNRYFYEYTHFTEAKWYDPKGKRFFDLRRLSELSGGFFIGGHLVVVSLLTVAKMVN